MKKTEKNDSGRQGLMCMRAAWKSIVQISKMSTAHAPHNADQCLT